MPEKHEQTATKGQPAHIAHVPNQHLPLIDVGGMLHHPIVDAIDNIAEIIDDLIESPRLTPRQRKLLETVLLHNDRIITELKLLAQFNLYTNDTSDLPITKGGK